MTTPEEFAYKWGWAYTLDGFAHVLREMGITDPDYLIQLMDLRDAGIMERNAVVVWPEGADING